MRIIIRNQMNEIKLNLDLLEQLKISPNAYVFLYLLFYNMPINLEISDNLIKDLEDKKFVKNQENGIIIRKRGIDLFDNKITKVVSKLDDFIDKYRSIFPAGVKSGGRLIKGDKQGCLSKLKTFKVKYPEYTEEDILEATKAYLDGKKRVNYDRTVCADYFISKDGSSMLASYCENMKLQPKTLNTEDGNFGMGKTKLI